MAEQRSRRGLVLVLLGVVVICGLVVGGIFLMHVIASGKSGVTAAPKAGDCWTTTFAAQQRSENWTGAPSVPCTTAHQSYTYALATLSKTAGYRSWLDAKGAIRASVDRAAYQACRVKQDAILPGITVKEALLNPTYYLPSDAQWRAGARWVRCDLTLIKVGSTVEHPALADLPRFASIRSTLEKNPAVYALCEDDPANNGPDGAETTYAECTGASDFTLLGQLTMSGPNGAAYPSLPALTASGNALCSTFPVTKGHLVVSEPPTKLEWTKYGDRYVDCWRNNN